MGRVTLYGGGEGGLGIAGIHLAIGIAMEVGVAG